MRNSYAPAMQGDGGGSEGETVISRQAIHHVKKTGDNLIDGVLSGYAWSGGSITYAFPNSSSDYNYGPEKNNNFGAVGHRVQDAVRFILDTGYGNHANDGFAVEGFTKLHVAKGSDSGATLRYAESNEPNPTAWGYYPSSHSSGGDVWFGTGFNGTANGYENAIQGNYQFATIIHETGHALGLKHGHETFKNSGNDVFYPKLATQHDSLEYSVMTYRSFVGDDAAGYNNETFGFPQTYMMADIAALQHMYGANFNVNDGNTTYRWTPKSGNTYVNGDVGIHPGANRIFATIWDGGGRHDRYDLSAYDNNVTIDLRPGAYSVFKNSQRADLDASSQSTARIADGNIYNALLYQGDKRSLIEDAVGGSGNDKLSGNVVGNHLIGKSGNDKFYGFQGNDIYEGGGGSDLFVFRKGWDHDRIDSFGAGDRINLESYRFSSVNEALSHAVNDGKDVVFSFGDGDVLRVAGMHEGDFHHNDFIL